MGPLLGNLALLLAWTQALQMAGRRLGPRRTGLLLGLPTTTAVALIACGSECGPEAATRMARAGMLGLVPAAALPLACAAALGRGWALHRALGAALVAYGAFAVVLGHLPAQDTGGRLAVAATLLVFAYRSRCRPATDDDSDTCRLDAVCALRLLIPAVCLALVTALRDAAGPTWAGLLTPFPGATLALLASTYSGAGPRAACRLANSAPQGALATLAFLAAFGAVGPHLGPGWGAAAGYLAALVILGAIEATAGPLASKQKVVGRNFAPPGGGRRHGLRGDAAGRVIHRRRVGGRRTVAHFAPQFEAI